MNVDHLLTIPLACEDCAPASPSAAYVCKGHPPIELATPAVSAPSTAISRATSRLYYSEPAKPACSLLLLFLFAPALNYADWQTDSIEKLPTILMPKPYKKASVYHV